jgi:hypothetical protein
MTALLRALARAYPAAYRALSRLEAWLAARAGGREHARIRAEARSAAPGMAPAKTGVQTPNLLPFSQLHRVPPAPRQTARGLAPKELALEHPQSTIPDSVFRDVLLRRVAIYDDGCWDWQGARNAGGYGQFLLAGRVYWTHHTAWRLAHGCEIPDGRWVLHKCHHPRCCNPLHLYDGTGDENARDRRIKERNRYRAELAGLTLQDCVAALYRVPVAALNAALLAQWEMRVRAPG